MAITPPDPGFVAALAALRSAGVALDALASAHPHDEDLRLVVAAHRATVAKLQAHPLAGEHDDGPDVKG
jgi:hypothetical protein